MRIPNLYLIGRQASYEQVQDALSIHPVSCVVIQAAQDWELASRIASQVFLKAFLPETFETGHDPIALIVEQAHSLIAVYPDGAQEVIL